MAPVLSASWAWMEANAFAIMASLYLALTVCLIALAIIVFVLSGRLARFASSSAEISVQMVKLRTILHEHAWTSADHNEVKVEVETPPVAKAGSPRTPMATTTQAIRHEIETLISDLSSGGPAT